MKYYLVAEWERHELTDEEWASDPNGKQLNRRELNVSGLRLEDTARMIESMMNDYVMNNR